MTDDEGVPDTADRETSGACPRCGDWDVRYTVDTGDGPEVACDVCGHVWSVTL